MSSAVVARARRTVMESLALHRAKTMRHGDEPIDEEKMMEASYSDLPGAGVFVPSPLHCHLCDPP
jgi:hypothetical protein